MGWLKTRDCCTVLDVKSPKSRRQPGHTPSKGYREGSVPGLSPSFQGWPDSLELRHHCLCLRKHMVFIPRPVSVSELSSLCSEEWERCWAPRAWLLFSDISLARQDSVPPAPGTHVRGMTCSPRAGVARWMQGRSRGGKRTGC